VIELAILATEALPDPLTLLLMFGLGFATGYAAHGSLID